MKIGILGSTGFIGSEILRSVPDSISYDSADKYEVLVNAAGNARKFQVNDDPYTDFINSVGHTYKAALTCKSQILISSIDIFHDSPYGFNKSLSEQIVKHYCERYLILRCAAVIGRGLKKGVVYDILNDIPVRLTPDSRLQLVTTKYICEIIIQSLARETWCTCMTLAGSKSITVEEIGKVLNKKIRYASVLDYQCFDVHSAVEKTSENFLKEFINE